MWVFIVLLCIAMLLQACWIYDVAKRVNDARQHVRFLEEHRDYEDKQVDKIQTRQQHELEYIQTLLDMLSDHTSLIGIIVGILRWHIGDANSNSHDNDNGNGNGNGNKGRYNKPTPVSVSDQPNKAVMQFTNSPDERPNNVGGCIQ